MRYFILMDLPEQDKTFPPKFIHREETTIDLTEQLTKPALISESFTGIGPVCRFLAPPQRQAVEAA